MKVALSIAGSDPSGGAGIQTDLKSFTTLGIHGTTIITCITVQNTSRVNNILKLPAEIVGEQIDAVFEDIKPDAVKTGMLYDIDIVDIVSKKIKKYDMKPVVDPVMVATSGDSLSKKDFVDILKKKIIPKSYILTPNIEESEILTKIKIKNIDDIKESCGKIYDMGAENVIIKGGHFKGEKVVDVFYDGKKFDFFTLPRIPDKKAHGSGCTLSSLITGYLAKKEKPVDAVRKSKIVLWNMIDEGYNVGKGSDVLNNYYTSYSKIPHSIIDEESFKTWYDLKKSVDKILDVLSNNYIAEVGMNFAYAKPDAISYRDICAINGRVVKTNHGPKLCGSIDFGASKHVASIVLAVMSFNKDYRSAINIKYSDELVEKIKKKGFKIGFFDREYEPKNIESTMEWGTKKSVRDLGEIPDFIYDKGDIGKEPMIRIIGKKPDEIVKKIKDILI